MASAIDPSKPGDGVPASKADLRANLQAAKTELNHGGFAEGFTPSNYGPPASSQVKDHLAALDAMIPSLGGAGGLTGWTDVKASFGAAGNGSTNDTTALQNALNSGAAVVYFPAGTFKVTAKLTVPPGIAIMGAGPGRTIIDARTASLSGGEAIFHITGTATSLPGLSSAITEMDGQINFSSSVAATLATGDWCKTWDSTPNSLTLVGNETFDGFTWCNKAASGSIAYPDISCLRTLPSPRTSGALSNVVSKKLDQRGLTIRDMKMYGPSYAIGPDDGPGPSGIAIFMSDLANFNIDNVVAVGFRSAGILTRHCANGNITNCTLSTQMGETAVGGGAHYGCSLQGSAYINIVNPMFLGKGSSVDFENFSGPAHANTIIGGTLGGPGTGIFSLPTGSAALAIGWHQGTLDTRLIGVNIQGRIAIEGSGQQFIGCTIRQGKGQSVSMFELSDYGPPLDLRLIGCKLYVDVGHFESPGGALLYLDGEWDETAGAPGSLVISDCDIYDNLNNSQPLIRIADSTVKNPLTGVVHIVNNRIAHRVGTTSKPFVDISLVDAMEVVIQGNVLGGSMTLGTVNADFQRITLGPNVIQGHITYIGLPTSTPGGSGRLWSDAGRLRIT